MRSFYESLFGAMGYNVELGVFENFFGPELEYHLQLEPLINNALLENGLLKVEQPTIEQLREGQRFHLGLYRRGILMWPDKIPFRPEYTLMHGPGEGDDQPPARRKWLREQLVALIAQIDKADQEAQNV